MTSKARNAPSHISAERKKNMYLARPKITPDHPAQLAKTPSVPLHRGPGNVTTVMARDPDQVKHPVTKKFLARYQNSQSTGEK